MTLRKLHFGGMPLCFSIPTDRIYAEFFLICMIQTTSILAISLQTLMNERTIKRIVDKIFEVIDSFSKLIILFKFLNSKNEVSHAIFDFRKDQCRLR